MLADAARSGSAVSSGSRRLGCCRIALSARGLISPLTGSRSDQTFRPRAIARGLAAFQSVITPGREPLRSNNRRCPLCADSGRSPHPDPTTAIDPQEPFLETPADRVGQVADIRSGPTSPHAELLFLQRATSRGSRPSTVPTTSSLPRLSCYPEYLTAIVHE